MTIAQREARFGRLLVTPALVVVFGLILYPVIYNLYLSLFDVGLMTGNTWVGFRNFSRALVDPEFWNAVWTTITDTPACAIRSARPSGVGPSVSDVVGLKSNGW